MIQLKSNILQVKEIIKPTKAEMFSNLDVGNRIRLSINIDHAGTLHSSSGTRASYILATNLKTGEFTRKSFNQMPKFLEKFKFKIIEDYWQGYRHGVKNAHKSQQAEERSK